MNFYRLKSYFLFITFLFLSGTFFSQEIKERKPEMGPPLLPNSKTGTFIDVNAASYPESNYSITQLVTDVLISGGSTCTTPNVSNVTVSPNLGTTDATRTWGYFNKSTSTFPFAAGVVLVTGTASDAGNAYIPGTLSGGPTTASDPDLVAAINPLGALNNTTKIEFDFVPTSAQVKFNYIFASEEYTSSYPCGNFSDGFALLLKPVGGAYTNMAILPGGAGPVSVTNIVPANFSCGPINAAFFAGLNTANIETNFNGRTIPLTAIATVVPGQSYHFKMVIADAVDSAFNSAVFLEAGSFNIGVQILGPAGVTLPSQINMCDNTPQLMVSSNTDPTATFQWLFNGNPIAGATSSSYTATQPGDYSLQVTIPGNSCPGVANIKIIGGTSPTVQDVTLTQCFGPGNVNFDLTQTQAYTTTTTGVSYTYYVSQADAIAGNANSIANPTSFSSAGNQTVYVSIKSGFCAKVAAIQLVKAAQMTATIQPPSNLTCSNPQITLNATGSIYPAGSTFHWVASNGGYVVSGINTLTPVVNTAGTYTLTIVKTYQPGDIACTATAVVNVTADKTPPVATVSASAVKICNGDSVTLTASGGVVYNWVNNAATGNTITVSPTTTTTYQVYAIGSNGCQSINPATITIQVVPAIQSTLPAVSGQICVGDQITLDAGTGPNFTYLWNTGATTQTITVNTAGTYTVTINNGVCTKNFSTQVIQALVPEIIDVVFENNTLTLTASNPSNGILEYSIDNGFTWQASNVFTNVQNNIGVNIGVRVKYTTCQSVLEYFTFVISNAITPNGDGVNDVVTFRPISNYTNFGASVFDRYGAKLFEANKNNSVWDGRFQGRNLPTATYWYQYHYDHPASKKPVVKTGWILLKNRD